MVATFLDIRSFSTFSEKGESFDTATYLSSVYSTILATYFPNASYFKPTGDGLLIIHDLPDDRDHVPYAVSEILSQCAALVEAFSRITADDYMINFPVPQRLGAGVARGTATRLMSGDYVLDYTGRCLNLAARLMDKARPYGVVFADDRAAMLMEPEVAELFSKDRVCIRGIAEEEPIPVYITAGVEITVADREPLARAGRVWGDPQTLSLAEIRKNSSYGFYLPRAPHSYETAMMHVEYPDFDKEGKRTATVRSLDMTGRVEEHPNGPIVFVPLKRAQDSLSEAPETTAGTFLGFARTKTTYVTFTPFLEPGKDSRTKK